MTKTQRVQNVLFPEGARIPSKKLFNSDTTIVYSISWKVVWWKKYGAPMPIFLASERFQVAEGRLLSEFKKLLGAAGLEVSGNKSGLGKQYLP